MTFAFKPLWLLLLPELPLAQPTSQGLSFPIPTLILRHNQEMHQDNPNIRDRGLDMGLFD